MAVNRKDLKDFARDVAIKNEDKALKAGKFELYILLIFFFISMLSVGIITKEVTDTWVPLFLQNAGIPANGSDKCRKIAGKLKI